RFEDALMQRLVKMFGLEKARHALERVVVDQDRAQERLLRFDIEGRLAIVGWGFGLWGDSETHGTIERDWFVGCKKRHALFTGLERARLAPFEAQPLSRSTRIDSQK